MKKLSDFYFRCPVLIIIALSGTPLSKILAEASQGEGVIITHPYITPLLTSFDDIFAKQNDG